MMMSLEVRPFHIVTQNGALITIGGGKATFEQGVQEVFWFNTEKERDADARVVSYHLKNNITKDIIELVELPKNLQAYAAMRQDALDWLRADKAGNAEWDAELYPALAITVECCKMTPTEAAKAINKVVKLNVLEPERERTIQRERLHALAMEYIG